RCSGLIFWHSTRFPINSSMASQRLVACKSALICCGLRISPRSIEPSCCERISPEQTDLGKSETGAEPFGIFDFRFSIADGLSAMAVLSARWEKLGKLYLGARGSIALIGSLGPLDPLDPLVATSFQACR